MRSGGPLGAATLIVALVAGGKAQAFVRATTEKGLPVYWAGSCAWIAPDTDAPMELPLDTVLAAVDRSVLNWQSVTFEGASACSYSKMNVDPAAPAEAHYDGKNVIKFRKDQWCRPAEPDHPQLCFSQAAAAITSLFYVPETGELLDADIELNDVNFTFQIKPSAARPRPGTVATDLEATLTHELGHFQGLDHTCWDPAHGAQPVDDQGSPVPDCGALMGLPTDQYTRITTAAMYPLSAPGDIGERTPKADDIAGICSISPRASDPGRCVRPTLPQGGHTGGCSCGRGAAPSFLASGLVLVLGGLRRRRPLR